MSMGDLVPHTGELILMGTIVAMIFGLGRLPQLSYILAGGKSDDGARERAIRDAARAEEAEKAKSA